MIIITSKIFKGIGGNNYIKNNSLNDIVSNKKKISSENDDWPFRMLIIGPSGWGKTLLHLINNFHPIDKNIFIR